MINYFQPAYRIQNFKYLKTKVLFIVDEMSKNTAADSASPSHQRKPGQKKPDGKSYTMSNFGEYCMSYFL